MTIINKTNTKISNKFIPRTQSHQKTRIKKIVKLLKSKKLHNTKLNKNKKNIISNKYIIAIPSYNRPELIQTKTLALLHKHDIEPSLINIFVADRQQYEIYNSKIPSHLYNKIIIGLKGLKNQRNFINRYYPEGYHIIEMDDDIDKIVQLNTKNNNSTTLSQDKSKTLKPIENLNEFIIKAFERCMKDNIFLWGVYPLDNAYFMTDTITTDLRFIVGPMFGIINRHRSDLKLTIDEKENSERTLQHWTIDGKVLRFNNVGIQTNYYKNKGGMQDEGKNRKEEALKSVNYLHSKYPKLTKIHLGKKSGMPELKLIKEK